MIWVWVLIAIILTVVGIFTFYNFYWLSRPQVFLIYNTKIDALKQTDDLDTLVNSVEQATGTKIATQADLESDLKDGLNFCTNGVMKDSTGKYIVGWPTFVDKDFNGSSDGKSQCNPSCDPKAGCVDGCGCNKKVNIDTWGTAVRGIWVKGNKPARLPSEWSSKGWQMSPFSNKRRNLGKQVENKYEIFGIPKLI